MIETLITPALVLTVLTKPRILDLARVFGVRLRNSSATKQQLASSLAAQLDDRLPAILHEFGREELVAACKIHGLSVHSPARRELIRALLETAGLDPSLSIRLPTTVSRDGLPRPGQIVRARHRQWLVERRHHACGWAEVYFASHCGDVTIAVACSTVSAGWLPSTDAPWYLPCTFEV